jgi:NADH-quinone oxidoreductase subunit G
MPFVEKTIDSELSGNIIDLCPVGALTSKPFRFAARTWELSRRKSVSPHDSLGSNLIVQVKGDRVKRVLPLENEELNECWLSDKDRFSYEALNGDDRLTRPMIRQGGTWKEVDWQTALEFAGTALKAAQADGGAQGVGALASPHATVEELYLVQKLVRGLGSDNVDFRLRQADFRLDGQLSGAPWLGMKVAEIGSLDRLLVIGSFLRKDAPLLAQRVRQAAKRGLQVSAVGSVADDWLLPVRQRATVAPSRIPSVLAQILKALAAAVGATMPDAYARLATDVSADAQAIAESLAGGEKVAVWLGNHVQQDLRFAEIYSLALEIARLSGGAFGLIGDAANSVGGYLAGAVPSAGGSHAAAMLQSPPKALLVFGAEPEFDFHDPVAAQAALQACASVVWFSSFKSASALEFADVMLPVGAFAETSGTYVNCEGRAPSFAAVAPAQGDARPGWKVLRVLGNVLGLAGFEFADSEAVRTEALGPLDALAARLANGLAQPVLAASGGVDGLERVADIPIYSADPLARRARSLQRTRDALPPRAAASSETLAALGARSGSVVRLRQAAGVAELELVADDSVAAGCVRVAGGHAATASLGPLSGSISVELM